MKFNEILKKIEEDKNYKPSLRVKEYISLDDKMQYLEDLVDSCIDYNKNGITKINFISKKISNELFMIKYYTNLELDIDMSITEQYEFLLSKGIIKSVKSKLCRSGSDFNDLQEMIEQTLNQEIVLMNSIEGIFATGIHNLIEKIPSQEKILEYLKQIENFDPKKLGKLKDIFNFVNKK